jgi:hypothetical protein
MAETRKFTYMASNIMKVVIISLVQDASGMVRGADIQSLAMGWVLDEGCSCLKAGCLSSY